MNTKALVIVVGLALIVVALDSMGAYDIIPGFRLDFFAGLGAGTMGVVVLLAGLSMSGK